MGLLVLDLSIGALNADHVTSMVEPFRSLAVHERVLSTRILLTPIIVFTGLPNRGSMLVRPSGKGGELVDQRSAKIREFVVHSGRYARCYFADDIAVAFQLAKRLGQHPLRHVRHEPLDLREPLPIGLHRGQNQDRPLVSNALEHMAHGTYLGIVFALIDAVEIVFRPNLSGSLRGTEWGISAVFHGPVSVRYH